MEYNRRAEFETVFHEEEDIPVTNLSNFLYQLKVFYTVLEGDKEFWSRFGHTNPEDLVSSEYEIQDTINSHQFFSNTAPNRKYSHFIKNLGEDELTIERINKESPLKIVFSGSVTLLTIAFIISGGRFELSAFPPKIKVEMPPLGEGIEKLKEAMKGNEEDRNRPW